MINTLPPGRPSKLSLAQKQEIARLVDAGPDPERDGVVPWRCVDLQQIIQERYGVRSRRKFGRPSAQGTGLCPHQRPSASPAPRSGSDRRLKNQTLPERATAIADTRPPGTLIELWFQDEMRVGQKNSTVYPWAASGHAPAPAGRDHRYESTDLFGALCPARDTGAALVLPLVNTPAMQRHLAEISATVTPGRPSPRADGSSRLAHDSQTRDTARNRSIVCTPPATPELNPAENVGQHLRQTYLGNRVFEHYDDIVDRLCKAWRTLLQDTGRIYSIIHRDWACVDRCL